MAPNGMLVLRDSSKCTYDRFGLSSTLRNGYRDRSTSAKGIVVRNNITTHYVVHLLTMSRMNNSFQDAPLSWAYPERCLHPSRPSLTSLTSPPPTCFPAPSMQPCTTISASFLKSEELPQRTSRYRPNRRLFCPRLHWSSSQWSSPRLQWLIDLYPDLYDPLQCLTAGAGLDSLLWCKCQRPRVNTYGMMAALETAAANGH
ncbi:hypothetical protein GQ600_16960 [Phytophthora cactorum]|nr:hypothetical protein GQ600_16960 [Phytophthora cactorum]